MAGENGQPTPQVGADIELRCVVRIERMLRDLPLASQKRVIQNVVSRFNERREPDAPVPAE